MKQGKLCVKSGWAALLCALLISPALVAEVYRWTDENGVTHFSQTPPPNGQEAEIEDVPENEVATPGAGIDFDGAQSNLEETSQGGDALSAAEQERQEIARRRALVLSEQQEQERLCNQARSRLARIEPNRQVFYTNEDGERVRMDDEERVAEVESLRDFIDTTCR